MLLLCAIKSAQIKYASAANMVPELTCPCAIVYPQVNVAVAANCQKYEFAKQSAGLKPWMPQRTKHKLV